jgi:valyl-tRNA synthetase
LWNVGKYLQNVLQTYQESSSSPSTVSSPSSFEKNVAVKQLMNEVEIKSLPLPERFIISKTHQLIEKVSSDLENFRFGEAGRHIYDFLWDDLADWYIETSKSHIKSQDTTLRASSVKTLVYVWDNCLRLLHPFMPYITETLWQNIPHDGEALMIASWPTLQCNGELFVDHDAIRDFEKFKKVVGSLRNARAEYNVDPGRKIGAIVKAPASFLDHIQRELKSFLMLARLDEQGIQFLVSDRNDDKLKPPSEMGPFVHLIVDEEVEVFIPQSGLIDIVKEKIRLNKQREKLKKDILALESRLANKNYVDKAPPHVIKEAQEKLEDLTQQKAVVENSLNELM